MQIVNSIARRVGLPSILLLATACGGASQSVHRFGDATHELAQGLAVVARGSGDVCEKKQQLDLDQQVALGANAEALLAVLQKDGCASFRETGALYARLALQLGAFGLAMKTLAVSGDQDYTEDISQLTASAGALGTTGITQQQIDAAGGLLNKLLSWFSQGYSRAKIAEALKESEADVRETIALLELVLKAYQTQLNGYSQVITQVGQDGDFTTAIDKEPEGALERRKSAQISLVVEHSRNARKRQRLLDASGKALKSVKDVHTELVVEAKRDPKEFDIPRLVASARTLGGEVAEFRQLVNELVQP